MTHDLKQGWPVLIASSNEAQMTIEAQIIGQLVGFLNSTGNDTKEGVLIRILNIPQKLPHKELWVSD